MKQRQPRLVEPATADLVDPDIDSRSKGHEGNLDVGGLAADPNRISTRPCAAVLRFASFVPAIEPELSRTMASSIFRCWRNTREDTVMSIKGVLRMERKAVPTRAVAVISTCVEVLATPTLVRSPMSAVV